MHQDQQEYDYCLQSIKIYLNGYLSNIFPVITNQVFVFLTMSALLLLKNQAMLVN